jgi:integral membrane protein
MLTTKQKFKHLILSGHIEGVSYLLLLFIAMPLKYFYNMPEAVRIVGMLHGILFVWFMAVIAYFFFTKKINFFISFMCFVLSLIPFGTFFLERLLKGKSENQIA